VVVWVFLTDNNTTPTKVVLSCFGLLVGLWQLVRDLLRLVRNLVKKCYMVLWKLVRDLNQSVKNQSQDNMAQASNRKRSFQKMKMAGENKTEVLKAVNVEIEKLRNKLEDKLEEVKDLQEKVKKLVAIVMESEIKIKVLGEDKHEQKDTSKKHSKVNDKENYVMTETKEHTTLLNCKICEIYFDKFCDPEMHIKRCHEKHQEFVCKKCEKKFVT
jgi:hypothetical protein